MTVRLCKCGCGGPVRSVGALFQRGHNVRHPDHVRQPSTTCRVEGCPEPVVGNARCRGHRNEHVRLWRGVTREQYHAMREAQGDLCAICGLPEQQVTASGGPKLLAIDHDHETLAVRDLLCSWCNNMLGLARHDPAVLRAAAEYVERHRENA
jgi:hypothetical protein